MDPDIIKQASDRIKALGEISDHPHYRVRSLLSPANRRAAALIMEWMIDAGLEVSHTIDGSVRGILPGSNPKARPLLIGSHFDTVVDAGAYDGPLGIISALAAVQRLQKEKITLPFPIHILGFSDEEGVRFHTTYIGSGLMVRDLPQSQMMAEDRDGQSLGFTLATEGWHQGATSIRYLPEETRGYIELHIEQGRVLEDMKRPAAGVSGLVGQTRLKIKIEGQADHAGTTPMPLRRDALAGAACCISEIERLARELPPAVATVGQIEVHPGAANAIAQTASFSIDLRHPDDSSREDFCTTLLNQLLQICQSRQLTMESKVILDHGATHCDEQLSESLLASVEAITSARTCLISGAGHDGVAMATVMPIGMIFIRCREGLSHHPEEFASENDIGTGIEILAHFLRHLPLESDA